MIATILGAMASNPVFIVKNPLTNSFSIESSVTELGCLSLANNIFVTWGKASNLAGKIGKRKVIVLGQPGSELSGLGLKHIDSHLPPAVAECLSCPLTAHHTESAAQLQYRDHALAGGLAACVRVRPFCRFDFADEWNNLGFGRILADNSIWGVQGGITVDGATELAGVYIADGDGAGYVASYLTLLDTPDASILWCARQVGPVDSTEWTVIERFLSDWRADEGFPCLPCVQQTPSGYNAIATMRLDCDEDISSARDVFEWYASEKLPFSLAVKTGLPMTPEHLAMLRDVNAYGGTLLSHSHTHPYNWGADKAEALAEANASRQWFRSELPDVPVPDYAVSPFHTNPPYAMQAIEEAGFKGVVSGIIHNDPEYLLGRAGHVPFTQGKIVSISQQSMLHGDCYAQQGENVDVHVQAFEAQYAARGIFGYLDHPFSDRYQYGWRDKAQRLGAHKKLVDAMRAHEGVLFWNQRQCFEWVRMLAGIRLSVCGDSLTAQGVPENLQFRPCVRYQGRTVIL